MKMRMLLGLVVSLVLCGVLWNTHEALFRWSVTDLQWSWYGSYWWPQIAYYLGALGAGFSVAGALGGTWWRRLVALLLVTGAFAGGFFWAYPIYKPDIRELGNRAPDEDPFPNNSVLADLFARKPDFDGLLCMATPGCHHCHAAGLKLGWMQDRQPDADIAIYLFTRDSADLLHYQEEAQSGAVPLYLSPDEEGPIQLTQGNFPVFYYVRNQRIIYRWSNGQWGYPALDWIEAGMPPKGN